jgi:hypothetical protein
MDNTPRERPVVIVSDSDRRFERVPAAEQDSFDTDVYFREPDGTLTKVRLKPEFRPRPYGSAAANSTL